MRSAKTSSGRRFRPGTRSRHRHRPPDHVEHRLYQILAGHTGQTVKKITKDCDRDYFMSASDAENYGLVDKVIEKKVDGTSSDA